MARITFIEFNGNEHTVEAEEGKSLMQVAVENLVPGIVGDCGGVCACATCHAYIDAAVLDQLPPRGDDEDAMLEGVLEFKDNSRLTCQIIVGPELDGLIVRMPESQC